MPMPTAVAIQWVEGTTAEVPSISGRVVKGFGLMLAAIVSCAFEQPLANHSREGQPTRLASNGLSLHVRHAAKAREQKSPSLQSPLTARTDPAHCSGILASRITLPHFAVSCAMNVSNSAGDIGIGMLPTSASRALICSSASAALISLLSMATISAGVFLGAPMPCHVLASKPGTDSAMVGTSGNACERLAVVTASARTLPPRTVSIDSGNGLK